MSKILYGLTALAAVACSVPAHADIMFSNGNTGGIGEDNILFNNNDTGTTIVGTISGSTPTTTVGFSSLTGQTLLGTANGQADIQNNADPGKALLTSMDMRAQAGTAWTDAILNMDVAGSPCGMGQTTCGTALVTATDDMGQSFSTMLTKGENFVTLIAGVSATTHVQEFIDDIQITEAPGSTTPFGWTDFKQPRVSGLCTVVDASTGSCTPISVVSEPGSFTLAGTGLIGFCIGLCYWRRNRWDAAPA